MNKKVTVTVVGGGIAGILSALFLSKIKNFEVTVFEKAPNSSTSGHGFIVQEFGINILKELGVYKDALSRGSPVSSYEFRRPKESGCGLIKFGKSLGILRKDLLQSFLSSKCDFSYLPDSEIESFLFLRKKNKIDHLVLSSGKKVYSDLYIICDGVGSRIRNNIFPNSKLSKTKVFEIVCTIDKSFLDENIDDKFIKYKDRKIGSSFGIIPASKEQAIWFAQFDSNLFNKDLLRLGSESFIQSRIGDWSSFISSILNKSDFKKSHVWKTTDLNTLSSFGGENFVLMGDAAHPFLPFTSQGTSSAMLDASVFYSILSREIVYQTDIKKAISNSISIFSEQRMPQVEFILKKGREIQDQFINPEKYGEDLIPLA